MSKSQASSGKGDLSVLFPGVEVEGYTVKPWTLRQAKILMPAVSRVVAKVGAWYASIGGEEGVKPEKLIESIPLEQAIGSLLPSLFEEAGEIISETLGIPREEADDMDVGKAGVIFMTIVTENIDYLKKYYGPAGKIVGKAKGILSGP